SIPAAELGAFFATFYTALNLLALLAQLLLMGWLLRTVGLHRAMWTLPVLLFLGPAIAAFALRLAAAIFVASSACSLHPSVPHTGTRSRVHAMPRPVAHPVQAAHRRGRPAGRPGPGRRADPVPAQHVRGHGAGLRRRRVVRGVDRRCRRHPAPLRRDVPPRAA